jgi:type IV secretory pathway VirB2 component (pilin)
VSVRHIPPRFNFFLIYKEFILKKSNLKILFLFLFLAAALPVFAQGKGGDIMPAGMTNLMDSIVAIFTSGFVKAILIACLCGCAIAYGFNKDNEKMKRNIIAIGIAIAILVGASQIVDMVWNAAGA